MGGVSIAESGGGRGKKALDVEIQLVPFIDLLCSLIAFLLMTAVWTQMARLELKAGNAAPLPPEEKPIEQVVDLRVEVHDKGFTVVENNKIELPIACLAPKCFEEKTEKDQDGNDKRILISNYDYKGLEAKLKDEKTKFKDQKNIVVVVDDGVPYNEMILTMDVCLGVGLDGISVSGTPL